MSDVVSARQEANSRRAWTQLLLGPVLWSVHFLASYLVVEAFCAAGWNLNILGINGISFVVIILTVLAILGSGFFALTSYRTWRARNMDGSLRDQFRKDSHGFEEPVDFMYFGGFLLSALFAATILMVGLPALFLHPC